MRHAARGLGRIQTDDMILTAEIAHLPLRYRAQVLGENTENQEK